MHDTEILSSCLVLFCPVLPCPVLSCPALQCLAILFHPVAIYIQATYDIFIIFSVSLLPFSVTTAEVIKLAEVYFNHASWQLNQEDGQLAIADAKLTDFR